MPNWVVWLIAIASLLAILYFGTALFDVNFHGR